MRNKTVGELRKEARRKGLKGTRVLSLKKAELIAYLETGKLPAEIKPGDLPPAQGKHQIFNTILKLAQLRVNISLVGPAGSGKTTIAENVASELGLPFYALSVGLHTTKSDLIGYMDANGRYVRTVLREAYENGGVFLMDEMDAGNPGVLTLINAMTSNGVASFPDGMVRKHKDFIFIAASNTFGRGADQMYVGRNQLDAATLDRFVAVFMDYDENLEKEIAPIPEFTEYVQGLRKSAYELKQRVVISPRASINGGKMLLAGMDAKDVMEMAIFKGVDSSIKNKILAHALNKGYIKQKVFEYPYKEKSKPKPDKKEKKPWFLKDGKLEFEMRGYSGKMPYVAVLHIHNGRIQRNFLERQIKRGNDDKSIYNVTVYISVPRPNVPIFLEIRSESTVSTEKREYWYLGDDGTAVELASIDQVIELMGKE